MEKEVVRINRKEFNEVQTLGRLYAKECTFYTLELPPRDNKLRVSSIPTGIYNVEPRKSPKFGKHFIVEDVQGRTYILIHAGNTFHDTLGCILIGLSTADINEDGYTDITRSKEALKKLLSMYPNGFTLEIW